MDLYKLFEVQSFLMYDKGVWQLILCVNLAGPWGPDVCLNIILDVSMTVFLDEIYI